MTSYDIKKCVCGQKIIFVPDDAGKLHPLDISSPVYMVIAVDHRQLKASKARRELPTDWTDNGVAYLVSHFRTCSHAEEFRRDYKKLSGEISDDGTDSGEAGA